MILNKKINTKSFMSHFDCKQKLDLTLIKMKYLYNKGEKIENDLGYLIVLLKTTENIFIYKINLSIN
jgi:hypothetical protein